MTPAATSPRMPARTPFPAIGRPRAPAAAPVAAALLACAASGAGAEPRPLWEAGLGVGALTFPAYRGADEQRSMVLPVPYFVYRGERLRADRSGVRGLFLERGRVDLTLSLAASLPVDSGEVEARRGMPDLRPTVEIGPSVEVALWRSPGGRVRTDLRMPLRAVVEVGSHPGVVGTVFEPRLNVDIEAPFGAPGWNLGMLAGPLFGDRRLHDRFYGVAPRYATGDRPAYEARGGYAGVQGIVSLSKRFPGYWIGAFVRHDSLRGATFEDSPLVRSRSVVAGGLAVSWIIGESKTLVDGTW